MSFVTDLELVTAFFEEMFGCVTGCGCWEADWDERDKVLAFAREPFPHWDAATRPTVAGVVAAMDRCYASMQTTEDLALAERTLNVCIASRDDFRDFFASARASLVLALEGVTTERA